MAQVNLKQRLIGIVVLISLAVIFIPMLLDVDWEFGSMIRGDIIPRQPEYKFNITTPSGNERFKPAAPAQPDDPGQPDDSGRLASKPEPNKVPYDTAQTVTVVEWNIADEELPKFAPEKEKIEPIPRQQEIPESHDIVNETEESVHGDIASTDVTSWVVQVGSFRSKANALALRDRLRDHGFASYTEEVSMRKGKHFRVRVGPELVRKSAISLKQRLAQEVEVDGIVLRH